MKNETDLTNFKRLKMGRLLIIKRLKKRGIKQIADRVGFIYSLPARLKRQNRQE